MLFGLAAFKTVAVLWPNSDQIVFGTGEVILRRLVGQDPSRRLFTYEQRQVDLGTVWWALHFGEKQVIPCPGGVPMTGRVIYPVHITGATPEADYRALVVLDGGVEVRSFTAGHLTVVRIPWEQVWPRVQAMVEMWGEEAAQDQGVQAEA